MPSASRLAPYAQAFDAEFLQLAYQIAIHGRDDLALAPDEYAGFTMTLLRLAAFRPETPAALGAPARPTAAPRGRRVPRSARRRLPSRRRDARSAAAGSASDSRPEARRSTRRAPPWTGAS